MNETINNATKEVIQYNRIGGTPESPIYFNDPVPRSNTPLTQTAIPVSDLQGATPIKVPNITPPRSEVPAIVAQADQSVVNYQEAQRRADELLKTQGNTAQNERNALNKLAENIFGQKSDIIGNQAQREKDLGIVEQQKALQEVNSQIADTTIQLRAEQDRVRNTPMSQSQKAVELGVIEDTYGRRLTDMAIRQSAAQGNISAIREESDRQTRLLTAPLDNKLQYLTTFAKENVDALDKKEQQRLNLIIQDVQSQKEDVKALQTAKSSLITEIANNGGGTNTNLVAQIQGAKTIDEAYAIAGKSGYVGKLDRQIKQAQLSKLNTEAKKLAGETGAYRLSAEDNARLNATPQAKGVNDGARFATALQEYKDAIEKYGTGEVFGKGSGTLGATYQAVVGAIKDYYALGTLDNGVEKLVSLGIPKPSVWGIKAGRVSGIDTTLQNVINNVERDVNQLSNTIYANSIEGQEIIQTGRLIAEKKKLSGVSNEDLLNSINADTSAGLTSDFTNEQFFNR